MALAVVLSKLSTVSSGNNVVRVPLPKIFKGIHKPHRYKVFYGGRGSGKSQTVARYLLLAGKEEKMRILCCREFQTSIKESVKQLLEDLIIEMDLSAFYTVQTTEIRGINGTSFVFAGLHHNIANIKSMHDVKKCWVEEAQTVSDASWSILIPTIRSEGSEIILTLNPELEEDPTYQRFIVNPPTDALILKVNYHDNPYFPEVLRKEMEDLKAKDYPAYLNVWEGQPKAAVEGAIFTQQLQRAVEEGRINDEVEYNRSVPVHTYWDLGKSDKTAIWFCQYVGMQWRVLRCYSNFLQDLEHYMEFIESLPYTYGTHYLPHDARQDRLGMARSVEDQVRARLGSVEVVDRTTHKVNSLEAAKAIFPLCHFHKTDCADGLSSLRRYSYAMDPQTGKIGKQPKHDIYSDCADAFQCFAMAAQPERFDDDAPVRVSYPRLG